MKTKFLLGPAGSGKTYRCLEEIRSVLLAAPEGLPLIFIAPKQATFQLERQLLAEKDLAGYTRLHLVSFERLAFLVSSRLGQPALTLLSDEGRLMLLSALLEEHKTQLTAFRTSAGSFGFVQELAALISEFQSQSIGPETIARLSRSLPSGADRLAAKLADLTLLLRAYRGWMEKRGLCDAQSVLNQAAAALRNLQRRPESPREPASSPLFAGLWVDGFAELSTCELEFLAALIPVTTRATLAFCLDQTGDESWLSIWSGIRKTFDACREKLSELPGNEITIETLPREPANHRFAASPALAHLEKFWTAPVAFSAGDGAPPIDRALRFVSCLTPEQEAVVAAREILKFVRTGGRFRETAVLLRDLESHDRILRRVFSRYQIPCFIDRRRSISHHPLIELTRGAFRLLAFHWKHEDWFAVLKTGLMDVSEDWIDQLENEALARGWEGGVWLRAFPPAMADYEALRRRLVDPFEKWANQIQAAGGRPNGKELSAALRKLFDELKVPDWIEGERSTPPSSFQGMLSIEPVHDTAWTELTGWIANLENAFPGQRFSMRDWLDIVQPALGALTIGIVPPALDQVMVGALDRSRNPDLRLVIVPGWNESLFPALPRTSPLLNDVDRTHLDVAGVALETSLCDRICRERYLAYIACTRARERLVVTWAAHDAAGRGLNPSPLLGVFGRLFPNLKSEAAETPDTIAEIEHVEDLSGLMPKLRGAKAHSNSEATERLLSLPAVAALDRRITQASLSTGPVSLSPGTAARLYGQPLKSSVTGLEFFAACPFRFFIHSGLRAKERRRFELDDRERGKIQHEMLRRFHERLVARNLPWRGLAPSSARAKIDEIGQEMIDRLQLVAANPAHLLAAKSLIANVQAYVSRAIEWMGRCRFDPKAVEVSFGGKGNPHLPAWEISLDGNNRLLLEGFIDRVDVHIAPETSVAYCIVIDYKSSPRRLEKVRIANGLQLQLVAYLAALDRSREVQSVFGVEKIIPAGTFYISLRREIRTENNRADARSTSAEDRSFAHVGRFDLSALRLLDTRPDALSGVQFKYRLKKDGRPHGLSPEAMDPDDFSDLLRAVEKELARIGNRIMSGVIAVDPYEHGKERACDRCDFAGICRIDSWTHPFRTLGKSDELDETTTQD